jgi:hypothetical protein
VTELFGRQIILQVGIPGGTAKTVRDLRVAFRVDYKGGKSATANFDIYNPAPGTIDLALTKGVYTRLLAGYDTPALIFEGGPIRNGVQVQRKGPDRVLHIEARTGRGLVPARVSITLAQPTAVAEVINIALEALGLPRGVVRLPEALTLPAGFAYEGDAYTLVQRLSANQGAVATILDNGVQVLPQEDNATEQVVQFSVAARNLYNSPQRRDKGIIEVTAALDPKLRPGRRFIVQSEQINGTFKARDVSFVGDLYSNQFYVQATGRQIK